MKTQIILSDLMYIKTKDEKLLDEIKEALTFDNPKYLQAKRYSKYKNINIPQYQMFYMPMKQGVAVPRGFKLNLDKFHVKDERIEINVKYPKCLISLRDVQQKALNAYLDDPDKGITILPTGAGKSLYGLYVAQLLRQKTLVIVNKDDLVNGWMKDAKVCFGEDFNCGLIKAKKRNIGEQVTIATIQTLNRLDEETLEKLYNEFGCVICDEVHNIGSGQYDLVNNFKGAYRIGLTATLERTDKLEPIILYMFGGISYKHDVKEKIKEILPVNVLMKNTGIEYTPKCSKYKSKDDSGNLVTKYKYVDSKNWYKYNNLVPITEIEQKKRPNVSYHDIDNSLVEHPKMIRKVIKDILYYVKQGKSCVAFFSKKQHIDLYFNELSKYLPTDEIVKYYGDAKEKVDVLKSKAEKAKVTLITYSIGKEGTNVKAWEVGFLVSSINNAKNVEQAVGRIRRTDGKKKIATLVDYYSPEVYSVQRHHYTRLGRYRKLQFNVFMDDKKQQPRKNNRVIVSRGF